MSTKRELQRKLGRIFAAPSFSKPPTSEAANAMVDRYRLSDLLPYRSFDPDQNFLFSDDGKTAYITFGLQLAPLLVAGRDIEEPLEAVINTCPEDSIIQFGMHAHDSVKLVMDAWLHSRLKDCDNELLERMARRRHKHFLDSCWNKSATRITRTHPRYYDAYVFVTVPYKGDMNSPEELDTWVEKCGDLRRTISGKLSGAKLKNQEMDEFSFRFLLRVLLNPNFSPSDLAEREPKGARIPNSLVDKESRIHVDDEGLIHFEGGSRPCAASVMSVDSYPDHHDLPSMRSLIGEITDRDEKIPCTFWAHTIIHVINADKARDSLQTKLGVISKQTLSDSNWYRTMMSHLFQRRDDTQQLLDMTRKKHKIIRVMTNITIFGDPETLVQDSEQVAGMWAKAGFHVSPERYIGMPMFLSGLPGVYRSDWDNGAKGLQRMEMMQSFNGATLAWCGADWKGTNPERGGLLLMSRRGQLATIDFYDSPTNKNIIVTATSGAGKSFLSVDMLAYVLSMGGIVYMIDKGGSYRRLNQLLGGQEIRFDPNNPKSLNPFWGIDTREDFKENFRMLAEVVKIMCFPNGMPPAFENRQIENVLDRAWGKHKGKLEPKLLQDELRVIAEEKNDPRFADLAEQMEPFCNGVYAQWFNGPRELRFDSHFVLVEMDELDADKELRTIVLSLCVNMITREMYLKNQGKFKILGVDEAWDLLSDPKASGFIETAARKIRKYQGALLTITQSCLDYEKSEAARAAAQNSAWKVLMTQGAASIDYAKKSGILPEGDDAAHKAALSVNASNEFSEFMVCHHDLGRDVFRYVVDPYTYWVSTTDPEDKNKIAAMQERLDERYREHERSKIEKERGRGLELSSEQAERRIAKATAPIHIVLEAMADGIEGLDLEFT